MHIRASAKIYAALFTAHCLSGFRIQKRAGLSGFRIQKRTGHRSIWPTSDANVLQASFTEPSYLGSGMFGEVWKARAKSGPVQEVVVKFAKKKNRHDIKLVKEDAEAVAKLKFECGVTKELHNRGFSEDCLQDVPADDDAPAFIALTFMGDLTLGDLIKVNESNEIHVWNSFNDAEKQQIMYHLLNDILLMWQPPAITHNDIASFQLVWNGNHGVGHAGVRVALVDFGEASRCEEDDYLKCLIEVDDDYGPGKFSLTTSKDLRTLLIQWVSAVVPQDLAYAAQSLVHGLAELPREMQALTDVDVLLHKAADQVINEYWFGPYEDLISIIPILTEASMEFPDFLLQIARVMWRGCHLSEGTSAMASEALQAQHQMLQDLIETSPYIKALAAAAS